MFIAVLGLFCVAACVKSAPSAPDEGLVRHLSKIQKRPTATDLAWRQPKEVVQGARNAADPAPLVGFAANDGLQAARTYSRERAGRGLLVWHNGHRIAADFSDGVNAQTPFASYSMHKSVLAITVLAAIEDGYIQSLDDPIGRYLDAWERDARGEITIRQLLTHSSGLAHYPFDSPESQRINYSTQIREAALAFPLAGEPGTAFQYSNVNSLIVGIALEDVLDKRGLRYAKYLSQRIWQPLGNRDAALWLGREGGTSRYQSGLEAGLEDWLNIGIMLANGGEFNGNAVLSAASVAALTTPSATNPAYGLHIWLGDAWQPERSYGPGTPSKVIHSAPFLAPDVWFFDGFGGQRVYIVPSANLVVARFGEVDFAYDDAIVVNALLRGLIDLRAKLAREAYSNKGADALHLQRFQKMMRQAQSGGGLDGYDPLIRLPGAPNHQSLAPQTAAWLDKPTRGELAAIADATNTQALQVWHRGAMVFSYFAEGVDAMTPIISRSMSKPLSVVAVGRAIERGYIKSLDQSAADFLSEWRDTPKADITIRDSAPATDAFGVGAAGEFV